MLYVSDSYRISDIKKYYDGKKQEKTDNHYPKIKSKHNTHFLFLMRRRVDLTIPAKNFIMILMLGVFV